MNKVILIGRVGKDPESTETYAKFSLATSKKWKDKSGLVKEETQWHNILSFVSVKFISDWIHKGDLVMIEGEIKYSDYEKDGVKRTSTSIFVSEIQLLNRRSDEVKGETDKLPFD